MQRLYTTHETRAWCGIVAGTAGWSSNNYVCQQGDSAASYGPGTPSSAKDGTWLFHSDACPSRCDEAKDCWACSQLEDCGEGGLCSRVCRHGVVLMCVGVPALVVRLVHGQ